MSEYKPRWTNSLNLNPTADLPKSSKHSPEAIAWRKNRDKMDARMFALELAEELGEVWDD